MQVISPYLTYPRISWWLRVINAGAIVFDIHEHYEKMSSRNRYKISGSNNSILLTVPLVNGRNQHTPIADVQISNESNWQVQHWRTLVSVYNRSPYFYHYQPSLEQLYEQPFTHLVDFNKAALDWVLKQLKFKPQLLETEAYHRECRDGCIDLRNDKSTALPMPKYYQVFEDRIGFVPDLSILDLLFSEGPHAKDWLRANAPKY